MISIPLFVTEQTPCSYLEQRNSQSLFVHPSFELSTEIYSQLIEQGFRRSGNHVYTPHCPSCSECIPSRLIVNDFTPNRSQKRCIKKNDKTTVVVKPAIFEQSHYDIYIRYQQFKHEHGDMRYSTEQDYISFLASSWCNTLFVEFLINEQLAAVSVVDLLDNALSAVYTFFDPEFVQYSLGTYAVLWQQGHARKLDLDYVYLGFWVKHCKKMSYKTNFQPIEGFIDNNWQLLSEVPPNTHFNT